MNFESQKQHLLEIAINIWSTWDDESKQLFSDINKDLYEENLKNPYYLMQKISDDRLKQFLSEDDNIKRVENLFSRYSNYMKSRSNVWDSEDKIAYLSMEYGLHSSLPIYSGGLGVLSGDHLKGASDLKLPLIGFGLLYKYGYFKQKIDEQGNQKEYYHKIDWENKSLQKAVDQDEKQLKLKVKILDEEVFVKVWKIMVGNVPLYLFDTDFPENPPKYQKITEKLYVSDREMRLLQEIILPFSTVKMLDKLNCGPSVYHLNEGHSALIVLKRLFLLMDEQNLNFEQAKQKITDSTVFTTHTPVPAGHETYSNDLIYKYFAESLHKHNIEFDLIKKLGKGNSHDLFSLSALAVNFSCRINGVSKLHSQVTRNLWKDIFEKISSGKTKIRAITNGVHTGTWLADEIEQLFTHHLREAIDKEQFWNIHQKLKRHLIEFVRERKHKDVLREDKLLIGFARRFATYKRATLILRNKERLLNLLKDKDRTIQFIFSGKAHPADEEGKGFIKAIIDFARSNNVEDRFIFLENYDMDIAQHLVRGVDVWLNNPIKPKEASGTSGMKAGMNGVLNFSVLDGWWPECYDGENGWKINAGEYENDPQEKDRKDAEQIYSILENEIIPTYYNRNETNIPEEWVEMMINAVSTILPQFNIERMLMDYLNKLYKPVIEND